MPMMTIESVKKAERLIRERARIAATKWEVLKGECPVNHGVYQAREEIALPIDEQLAWALEEFRKRKLDSIDAELRELGVDPTAQDAA
jgi:hypothetical protein